MDESERLRVGPSDEVLLEALMDAVDDVVEASIIGVTEEEVALATVDSEVEMTIDELGVTVTVSPACHLVMVVMNSSGVLVSKMPTAADIVAFNFPVAEPTPLVGSPELDSEDRSDAVVKAVSAEIET